DGLAGRIPGGPIPRSPRPGLRETLRFLSSLHHNLPWRLPRAKLSSPTFLDATQNIGNNCLDNVAKIDISQSPPGPASQGGLDNSPHARDSQHRHNLPLGRRTPDILIPKKMTDLLFLAFAAVTIGAAILAIEARDLVYGAAALG